MRFFDWLTIKLYDKTHRIKKTNRICGHQYATKIYVPQWWFIWWHYYWYDIGYQAVVLEKFDTMAKAYEFITPHWMPEKESKLEFYKKQDEINRKLDEANKDF